MKARTRATEPAIRPSSHWTGWGQWLALITMTTDHITRYVLPTSWDTTWAGSSLGRIAMPLFAAMVAWHGLFNTRNPLRYARRILVIGLIAQVPYTLMPRPIDVFVLNICFTLAAGLAWGTLWAHVIRQLDDGTPRPLALSLAVLSIAAWYWLGDWVEYGHYGLLMIPLYMLAMHALHDAGNTLAERFIATLAAMPVLLVAGQLNTTDMAKSFTVGTCLVMLLLAAGVARHVPEVLFRMPRRLWLAWYPGHFAVIALIVYWPG
ncbi:TraX family protein [Aidingimonas lacisalsi]|uniref:TraX family protein n=1 Tax=Aidingimonas lacisalsi TaxID=2604086 RepID=UPI0011D1B3E9|nr:TraX family protein [Aidingimonas lacisalsi]